MANEYLEGDPRADENRFLFRDLAPFVQWSEREFRAILDLLNAGRTQEALECAESGFCRAGMLLKELEVSSLPRVDIDASDDAADERTRRYRG